MTIIKRIPSPLPYPITLKICPFREYQKLAHFHYRAGPPGPVDKSFGLYIPSLSRLTHQPRLIGIIIYCLPPLENRLRNLAINHRYTAAINKKSRTLLINKEIRTIARVIIDPQFRSLGLAASLVRETLPLAKTLFVEASAVMGKFNPFFEKAGMTPYHAPNDLNTQILLAAFDHIGISHKSLLDIPNLLKKIESLKPSNRQFLLTQIEKYYTQTRRAVFSSVIKSDLSWLLPRIISTLFAKPVYYIWKNHKII